MSNEQMYSNGTNSGETVTTKHSTNATNLERQNTQKHSKKHNRLSASERALKKVPKNSLSIDNIGSSTLGGKSGIKLQFPAFSIEIECNFCPQTLSAILTVLNVQC